MLQLYALRIAFSVLAMVCLFAAGGRAAPVVPQCAPGTLTQYADLGENGCSLGDKVFGDFDFDSVFGTEPTSGNSILVTPIATPLDPGFMFVASVPFTVTQLTGPDSWILNYAVHVNP